MRAFLILAIVLFSVPAQAQSCGALREGEWRSFFRHRYVDLNGSCFAHSQPRKCEGGKLSGSAEFAYPECDRVAGGPSVPAPQIARPETSAPERPRAPVSEQPSWARVMSDVRTLLGAADLNRLPLSSFLIFTALTFLVLVCVVLGYNLYRVSTGRASEKPVRPSPSRASEAPPPERPTPRPEQPQRPKPEPQASRPEQKKEPPKSSRKSGPILPSDRWS